MTKDAAGRILSVECDKGDEFAYVDAERVQRGDLNSFLPFACWKGKKSYEFAYRVGALASLEQVLANPIDSSYLRVFVESILAMMRQCEASGLSRLRVMFDLPYVYLDASVPALRFAYVPMRSYVSPAGESGLLVQLCREAKVSPSDQPFVAAIWDYACRTAIMTSVGFESFLRDWGYGVDRGSTPRRKLERSAVNPDMREAFGWDFVGFARQAEGSSEEVADRGGDCAMSGTALAAPQVVLVRVANGTRYELGEGVFVVGRAADCAISLVDAKSVSRNHAKLTVDGGVCQVQDLKSTNGVVVNGSRLKPDAHARLAQGDTVLFGNEEFCVAEIGLP